MRKEIIAVLAALVVPAVGSTATEQVPTETLEAPAGFYQAVDSFNALGGLHSFEPLDNARLIVWRTPFEPYLVELAYPSLDLRFANGIAIDSSTSRIHARFDSVRIRGIKYPIGSIYKLSREQARAL